LSVPDETEPKPQAAPELKDAVEEGEPISILAHLRPQRGKSWWSLDYRTKLQNRRFTDGLSQFSIVSQRCGTISIACS
jgi:hypothetical protein